MVDGFDGSINVPTYTDFSDDSVFPAAIASDFQKSFGESLADVLDIDQWHDGQDLAELYDRLNAEVAEAVKFETDVRHAVRKHYFQKLRTSAVPQSGVYQVTTAQIEQVHRHILFNGGVEACDANLNGYDTLPITIMQIGVSLVQYNGRENSWVHRMFRRDLRARHDHILADIADLFDQRGQRNGFDQDSPQDFANQLVRRGIMSFAERAALLNKSSAPWRMGHGMPAPFDLLTGSGSQELLDMSIALLHRLIEDHRRFVFVPSTPGKRDMLTIGEALNPLEYIVFESQADALFQIVSRNRIRGPIQQRALDFARSVGPQILVGLFRAGAHTPVQVFYAHRDHVHEAALICLADSLLQAHRGFPMLIDLADMACRNNLGIDTLIPSVEMALVESGTQFRFLPERYTRDRGGRR